ncbi:MAG: hypothetical protein NTZ13_01345 [Candidatus Parcubacteria bacterium]|nr:hypothetical protein [Candidatus Parcubacteria bacterium]
MSLVEITEEQQKILDKYEFERLASERDEITKKIFVYRFLTFKPMIFEEDPELLEKLNEKIRLGESQQKEVDIKLAVLRKKLGIETPTINTEL